MDKLTKHSKVQTYKRYRK